MERYEYAAVKSQTTLALLNIGQGVIIAVGLIGVMSLAVIGVRDGSMTIGDIVMVNAYLIQLYLPLNFLGFAYREIRQGMIDMEQMFRLLDVRSEEHTSELQSLMRISYAVFCLQKKKHKQHNKHQQET